MKWCLKHFPDGGWEYSPVGRDEKPREGFEIVDTIPQDIRDREPGGKDWIEPVSPQAAKLSDLEARVLKLEGKTA
jgi:elongation factor P hydroxylase